MNPVLILTHNCLELTKKCVESVRAQDIPTEIYCIDNGSTDGTEDWDNWAPSDMRCGQMGSNRGVSFGWNHGLTFWFKLTEYYPGGPFDHVLVLNNDTQIPPWFYRSLLSAEVPFVTGASASWSEMLADAAAMKGPSPLTDGPDFSAFLIRRECREKVGPFDETMVHYCSDLDYDIRARRAGITLLNSHVKFYHERSSTIRNANPFEREVIQRQADADRERFREKWGVEAGGEGYAELFTEATNANPR